MASIAQNCFLFQILFIILSIAFLETEVYLILA